ncbi:hypothetical protein ZWY2020_056286 [Hordeum vulgare]|nr:hypothetical protein ZWY2020_056286 [Hordeum vulgare]
MPAGGSSPWYERTSDSSLLSSTARSEPPSSLWFRAGLRRRISGGPRLVPPSFLVGILHTYTSPSLPILCYRWRCTPWEFPVHHGRRRQATNLPNAVSSLSTVRFLPPLAHLFLAQVLFKNADKNVCRQIFVAYTWIRQLFSYAFDKLVAPVIFMGVTFFWTHSHLNNGSSCNTECY